MNIDTEPLENTEQLHAGEVVGSNKTEALNDAEVDKFRVEDDGIPDLSGVPSFQDMDSPGGLDDLFFNDSPPSSKKAEDTPLPIRELSRGDQLPLGADNPNVLQATKILSFDSFMRPKIALVLIAVLATIVLVLLMVATSTDSEDAVASSTTPPAELIEEFGEIDDYAVVKGNADDIVFSEDDVSPEALATVGGYDTEKCASPKTDRAWMECSASAYAAMRAEQKLLKTQNANLEAQIKDLESNTPVIETLFISTILGFFALCLACLFVLWRRKRSGLPIF